MEDLNQFVPDVRFEKIPIRNLVSNQEYQRNLSQKHIRRTVANFDLLQVNPVKVSRRDGINYDTGPDVESDMEPDDSEDDRSAP